MKRVYKDIHEAYLKTLADVYDTPDFISSPRGQKTREKLNVIFTIINPNPTPIITKCAKRNKVIESYTQKEMDLYESGSNRVEDFEKASKFWGQLANPDGTINSAYGYLVFVNKSHGNDFEDNLVTISVDPVSQGCIKKHQKKMRTPWEWCFESLVKDKDTRQAILRFSLPEHQWMGNKDQTCTLHGIFLIRDNHLYLTINMRSNDLTFGLAYDLPWFVGLLHKMHKDLLPVYPELKIGEYTHMVHSLHIYDRDEDKILRMLGRK